MVNFLQSCILLPMRIPAIVLLIFVPTTFSLAADPLQYFIDDADRLEEDLSRLEKQAQWDAEDRTDFSSQDLLPATVSTVEDAPRGEDTADSPFVQVRIDGVSVSLSDVPRESWFAPYVRSAADEGMVSGYRGLDGRPLGLFGPADAVTVEQIAKIALLAAGTDPSTCGTALLNVSGKGRWSEVYLRCAESLHWTLFADGSIDPVRPATRAEVIVTVLQAFGTEIRNSDAMPFTDIDSSTEFQPAIITAYEDHIVGGYTDADGKATGKFGPMDPVNRAEVAKIVVLAKEVYGQ